MSEELNKYKFDSRTEEEFVKDMKKGLHAEVCCINTFREILNKSDIESPDIVYCGSEKEGEIVYDSTNHVANVDIFPDYLLKYKVRRRIQCNFIEVKVCNPYSRECFFKVKQLEQYRDLGKVLILFVMGFQTDHPKYILVNPMSILNMGIEPTDVYGKKTIKVPTHMFNWYDFRAEENGRNPLRRRYIKEQRR